MAIRLRAGLMFTGLIIVTADLARLGAEDCDGDGLPDETQPSPIGVYLEPFGSYLVSAHLHAISSAELDGDGYLDLVAADRSASQISVLGNERDGTFEPPAGYTTGSVRPEAIVAADLNGDGHVDVAAAGRDANDLAILFNGGPGWLSYPVIHELAEDARPTAIEHDDLDADGDLDLCVVDEAARRVSILRNAGRGTFAQVAAIPVLAAPRAIAVADLDADGDPDVTVAEQSTEAAPGGLSLFFNDGTGVPGTSLVQGRGQTFVAVTADDLDGDGSPDLAALEARGYLHVFHNAGGGRFDRRVRGSCALGAPPFLEAEDLSGDGAPELIEAQAAEPGVCVHGNGGGGAFGSGLRVPAAGWVMGAATGDVDLDGRVDLAWATMDGLVEVRRGQVERLRRDCNANGISDACDVRLGASRDCNRNGVPDECELASGSRTRLPCELDGLPHVCEPDADRDRQVDACDPSGLPGPTSFRVSFDAPAELVGEPGEKVRAQADMYLHSLGGVPGADGAQGWSFMVAAPGVEILEATTDGTAIDELFRGGFKKTEVQSSFGVVPPRTCAVTAIVLSFTENITLDPGLSPHHILSLTLEDQIPPAGCESSALDLQSGCVRGGQPVANAITVHGTTVSVTSEPRVLRTCTRPFRRGDATGEGRLDLSDAVAVFAHLFLGSAAPPCLEAANANADGRLDIADGIFVLGYLFNTGPAPPAPGPPPGPCGHPAPDGEAFLGCAAYLGCA